MIELFEEVPAVSALLHPGSCHKQGPLRQGVLLCMRYLYAQYAHDATPYAP